ncbi:PQQ-binding-like beta-propeller repeat protein [Halovivax limisalsi]|uniref:outer membrane protein assembly factor BamB family protein n=1 Tax=Halovivax limisalsi TaxID=1453760 RepID=UPI001FFDEA2B|nr:PQQ-binding-like beta-propeller repeat protein [Halovivax limisalsi]
MTSTGTDGTHAPADSVLEPAATVEAAGTTADLAARLAARSAGSDGASAAANSTVYVGSQTGELYAIDADSGDVRWTFQAENGILSSPTVVGGTVYVPDDDANVYAIDAATGTERWRFEAGTEHSEMFSSPTVVDGTVYVGSYDIVGKNGTVHALDAADGTESWSYETGGKIYSSPTVVDGTVYVGARDNNVHAIDAESGTEQWVFETGDWVRSSPTVFDGTVYVGSYDNSVYAIDAESGAELWSFDTGDRIYASPTVVGGTVYIRSNDVYAIDAAEGTERWSADAGSWGGSSVTIDGGTAYVGSDDGRLYAIDAANGSQRWSFGTGEFIRSTPTVADGTVYVGSVDDRVYAVNAETGTAEWSVNTGRAVYSSPTVVDDPADGDSTGSRVSLGTLGHHAGWDGSPDPSVTGIVVDGRDRTLPGVDVEIRTPEGETVTTTRTDDEGSWSVPLQAGTYVVEASYGTVQDRRTIEHAGGGTSVTHMLQVCAETDILVRPDDPSIAAPVQFRACLPGEDVEWDFGDGKTASGLAVSHRYDEAGTYEVSASANGQTVTRTIEVDDTAIVIRDYADALGGRILESVTEENLYRVRVGSVEPVESVTVELEGSTFEGSEIDADNDVWQVVVDTSELDSDATATITATDAAGNEASETTSLDVVSVPSSVQFLLDVGDRGAPRAIADRVAYDGASGSLIPTVRMTFFELVLVDDANEYDELGPLTPWRTDLGFDLTAKTAIGATVPSGTIDLGGEITGKTEVAGNKVLGGGGADLRFDGNGLAKKSKIYFLAGLERVFPFSPPVLRERIEVIIGGQVGTDFVADGTGNWDFVGKAGVTGATRAQTNVAPGVDLSATAGLELGSQATFDLPPGLAFQSGNISVKGFLNGKLDATVFTKSLSIIWPEASANFGAESAATIEALQNGDPGIAEIEEGDWRLQDRRGTNPLPGVPTVDEASADAAGAALGTTGATTAARLTDRPYQDTEPAIASSGGETVAVWSSQGENRSTLEGRDIVVRTHDGSNWGDPVLLTDDERHDATPSIAVRDETGDRLLAWTKTDADLEAINASGPEDVYPHQEIAIARYDGDTWSEPTLVTDSDDLTHAPVVAAGDDRWLVAWERNPDANRTVYENRSVEYVVHDGSGVIERGAIADAMSPAVGATDDGFDLSYYEPQVNGTERGAVVRGTVSGNGTYEEQFRNESRQYVDHDADGGQLAWVDGPLDEPNLSYHDGDGFESLPLAGNMTGLEELSLEVEGNETLLTYRGRPETQPAPDLAYRFARDGEWVVDRRVVGGPEANISLYHSDAALESDSFSLIHAASDFGPETKNDIFVARHDFHPDFSVAADAPSNVTAGDSLSVEYRVRNVGETASNGTVPVVLSSANETIATAAVGPLAPNETATGTFDATADESGTLSVAVDPSGAGGTDVLAEREGWLPSETSLTTGTPALRIDDVETTVAAANASNGTITVTVANGGDIPAESVPVALEYGNETFDLAVDAVPVDGTATANLTVDPTSVNASAVGRFVIDPAGDLDPAAIANRTLRTPLFAADLAVDGPAGYVEADGRLEARIDVANRGSLPTTATVRAVEVDSAGNETVEYGNATVELDGTGPSETTFERVSIPLSGLQDGDPVRFVADSSAVETDRSSAVFEDEVGPVVPEHGSVSIDVIDHHGDPLAHAGVFVDGVGEATAENGTAAFRAPAGNRTLSVDRDGFQPVERPLTVDPDDVTEATVELAPVVELASVEIPETVTVGESVAVNATLANPSETNLTDTVSLAIDDDVVAETVAEVEAGSTATVALSWTPAEAEAGNVTATIATTTDAVTEPITVERAPTFDVEIVGTNAPVTEGDDLVVDVAIESDQPNASVEGGPTDQEIELVDFDGTVVDATVVELEPGNSTQRSLVWETAAGDAGTGTVTVSSEDDTATASVAIEAEAGVVELGNESVAAGEVATIPLETDRDGITGYAAEIHYDADVVAFENATGVDLADPAVEAGNGVVTLTVSGDDAVDAPTVASLSFEAVGAAGNSTALSFEAAATELRAGSVTIQPDVYRSGAIGIETACSTPGDVDDDGTVTSLDATLTLRHIAGLDPAGFVNPACADLTGDGEITPADVTAIHQRIVGIGG